MRGESCDEWALGWSVWSSARMPSPPARATEQTAVAVSISRMFMLFNFNSEMKKITDYGVGCKHCVLVDKTVDCHRQKECVLSLADYIILLSL